MQIEAKNYNSRDELERYIITNFGKDTSTKDAIIVGTHDDVLRLRLKHGQLVWGVVVAESDYKQSPVVEHITRGKIFDSTLNGQKTITHKKKKNAQTNQSRNKR